MPYKDPETARLYGQQWYLRHREKTIARSAARYQAKREEILRRLAEHAEKPAIRARIQERWKVWYEARRQERIAYTREWRAKNPDKAKLTKAIARINRRARELGAQGSFTTAQWLQKVAYHGWRCIYCHIELSNLTLTVEHRKELSRGGSNWPANLAPACATCNKSRRGRR